MAKKGQRNSIATEFKKGDHKSPSTEFKLGHTPWHKGKKNVYTPEQLARITKANQKIAKKGKNSPHWKGGFPKCLDCGKQLSSYKAKRCHPHANAGERAYLWKGGVTKDTKLQRVKFRKYMQPKVLARDNYTCQVCKQYGGQLQVDHIESWAKHPDLRFNMENCRTLCMACHYYVTFKRKLPEGALWGHNLCRRIV